MRPHLSAHHTWTLTRDNIYIYVCVCGGSFSFHSRHFPLRPFECTPRSSSSMRDSQPVGRPCVLPEADLEMTSSTGPLSIFMKALSHDHPTPLPPPSFFFVPLGLRLLCSALCPAAYYIHTSVHFQYPLLPALMIPWRITDYRMSYSHL